MTNVYIKTVEGGENTNPDGTDALMIDDGTNSEYVQINNLFNGAPTTGDTIYFNGTKWVRSAASTDGYVWTSTGAGAAPAWETIPVTARYVLYGQSSNESPADSTTYYFGTPLRASITTTAAGRKIFIPYAGTITRVDTAVFIVGGGTSSSNETSTLSLRLNNTSDTTVSSAIVCNQTAGGAASFFNTTGLSVAVVAGDYVELKWATPAWTTNPVLVNIQCQIYVD